MTASTIVGGESAEPAKGSDESSTGHRREHSWLQRPRPWVTWVASAFSVAVFLFLLTKGEDPLRQGPGAWFAPSSHAIWDGKYWALITSVFVHLAWWHLMFNVYWLWILGGALERHIGSGKYLVFFLSAAIVSSGMQLGFAGNTGIGLSGVVYAIFGFLWWYRKATPEFISLLNPRTVQLFLGWLVVCIVLTVLKIWQVGNAAHVAGLLFGVTTAASFDQARRRSGFRLASAGLLAGSLAPLFWCPWSVHWIAHRAYDAHVRGDLDAAIRGYERSLAMGLSDREWALQNLAIAYRGRGDEGHFGSTMKQLRRINAAAAQEVETRMKNDAATKSTGH